MADQCIVCLENLNVVEVTADEGVAIAGHGTVPLHLLPPSAADSASAPATAPAPARKTGLITGASGKTPCIHDSNDENIALIDVCGHTLHDSCLKEWTGKANSCPICRQAFNLVHVYDKLDGTLLSSYKVADKKQVAEFDAQAWLDENPEDEEEESVPCPICNLADHEEVLLLCDGCNTPYHTYCLGMGSIPRGHWFCMECTDDFGPEVIQPEDAGQGTAASRNGRNRPRRTGPSSYFFPRTQARMRRSRQRARSDQWQGAWGAVSSRVLSALNLDLDYDDDDDDNDDDEVREGVQGFRLSQQLHEREREEHRRWQQRLSIATRLGAGEVFQRNLPEFASRVIPATRPPARQSQEERRAWRELEAARDCENDNHKRKSRSSTAEPLEPQQEPERKLKRPRTRRLPNANGASSLSAVAAAASGSSVGPARLAPSARGSPQVSRAEVPSFLSSLLREVELSTPSDEDNMRALFGPIPGANDASSPASSPSASTYSSPRASSMTPPPNRNGRPASPSLSLSSHIEPVYPLAKFSPSRLSPKQSPVDEGSDTETRSRRACALELRQPQPRRAHPLITSANSAHDASPARSPIPFELKENINHIVRGALRPHWKNKKLTSEQYSTINRDVSRRIYEKVTDPSSVDEDTRKNWVNAAAKEVARAIAKIRT